MFSTIGALNPAVRRRIRDLASELGKKFYKAWEFENPEGETYLFGRFGKLREGHTIATIAVANPHCAGGWEPTR